MARLLLTLSTDHLRHCPIPPPTLSMSVKTGRNTYPIDSTLLHATPRHATPLESNPIHSSQTTTSRCKRKRTKPVFQCSAVQCNAIQCNAKQCNAVHSNAHCNANAFTTDELAQPTQHSPDRGVRQLPYLQPLHYASAAVAHRCVAVHMDCARLPSHCPRISLITCK